MVFDLWGASATVGIAFPTTPSGYILLLLYILLLGYIASRCKADFQQLSSRWQLTLGLTIASFIVSQLFPIRLMLPNSIAPIHVTLFAFVPLLLAGVAISPAAAMVVGFTGGLGYALGQSHAFFDPFHFAFAATAAAALVQLPYNGRFYQALRQPIAGGLVVGLILALLTAVVAFVTAGLNDSLLAALDLALYAFVLNFWSLIIAGIVGGAIVMLLLIGLPQLRKERPLTPSPEELSLRRRLLNNFVGFAILLTTLIAAIVITLSIILSTRLVLNQMAHDARTVSDTIPDFQAHLQSVLMQGGHDGQLLSTDGAVTAESLQRLFRSSPTYRRIILIGDQQEITAFYPQDVDTVTLTDSEETAVTTAFTTNTPTIALADSIEDEHVVSFVIPVLGDNAEPGAALIGRVPSLPLNTLIAGLQGTVGDGNGFIVDERGIIVAHPDLELLLNQWDPPVGKTMAADGNGMAVQVYDSVTGEHNLHYYLPSNEHSWTVVITAPYEDALRLALSVGVPLFAFIFIIMGAFYINLTIIGRDITKPISELAEASTTIAAGGDWQPPATATRQDEIGQLTDAFASMYTARNKQLHDSELLLKISQEISNTINLKRGMTALLAGMMEISGADGARVVVLNPNGRQPLTFGEGALAREMGLLDGRLMVKLRRSEAITITTPDQIRTTLELKSINKVRNITGLSVVPLSSKNRFQGIIWVGYEQGSEITEGTQALLERLATQTAVLVENAHLFAAAEGGRRRLAAVLASATDAIIVTDQTNRVLLINRAMERTFNLGKTAVAGRPVADIIPIPLLLEALTGKDSRARNIELLLDDGRTFHVNASTIISNDKRSLGRVAVLHDITHLKEIDAMKTDFVATVSHDLRGPLTYMRGYVNMIPMLGELEDKQQEYVDKVLIGIDQMTQLINDLLDLGRIEAGINLRYEHFDLKQLLTDVAAEHWQHAYASGINLSVDLPDDLPAIDGDVILLRQAITNYVANGIKYAPDSGVMKLHAEFSENEVIISVQDNGPGIPPEAHPQLFEKFYRADRNDGRKVKGSGLGLALVKSIAERHGGRVWCQSQLEQGSAFYIALPLAQRKSP